MTPLSILTDNEIMFRDEIIKFAAETIRPHVLAMDEQELLNPKILQQCFEMGLMGIDVDEQFGGTGGSFFMACLAIEALSSVDPAVGVFVDVQNTLVNNIIHRWASKDQQQEYFPKLCQQTVGAFCLTEPNSGSDAFALRTEAKRSSNGWILNGRKCFITNAQEAGLYIVFANTDFSKGYKGITAFLVERDNPGLTLGKKETKLGIRASSTCDLIFENLEINEDAVLGEVGKGYKIAIETLNEGRIGIAAQMLGLATGAFQGAWQYAKERSQFGKPINQFQGLQFQLARLACDIEGARLLVYNAARLKEAGHPFAKEAAIAKIMASETAERVASQALEVYGGYGFIKEFPAEKFYRDAKIGKLYEGTSNLQLQTIFKILEREDK